MVCRMKIDSQAGGSRARRRMIRTGLALCALPVLPIASVAQTEPKPAPKPPPMPPPRRRPHPPPLGFRVEEIDAAAARTLGVGAGLRVVYSVALAYESGLRLDDVIVEVNGRAVTGADAFWSTVDAAEGRVALLVRRGGERLTVRIAP